MRPNETRACEAVVRILEKDFGVRRRDVTFPETDGSGPPVEMRLILGNRRFAIEHTLIEPFPEAVRLGREFQELTAGIFAELDGHMPPPGVYGLLFPLDSTSGRHRRTHERLRETIIDWVRAAANELHAAAPSREDRHRRPNGYEGERRTTIEGLDLVLRRRVHWSESGRHDGRLFPARIAGEDLEARRSVRLETALERKLGKLMKCRQQGDRTVLILENTDITLTNHVLVAEALGELLATREDSPDHIFIVDTTIPERWSAFRPVINGTFDINMEWIDVSPPEEGAGEEIVTLAGKV